MQDGKPEIYLAGPEVFLPDPLARAAELKRICDDLGAIGRFPLDNQVTVESNIPDQMAANISAADEDLIGQCDALVANMAPFRGPSMDCGTAYEMGLAKGLGKLVVAWSADQRRYSGKVRLSTQLTKDGDWFRDEQGMLVRDFGLRDNLMMVKGAAAVFDSFEEAVAFVVRRLACSGLTPR
jgi:nucleoside 2-deoxyribosyltransferase